MHDLPHNCRRVTLDPDSDYRFDPETKRYTWVRTPMRGFLPVASITYGRWTGDERGAWMLVDELSYSDYSGTRPIYESNVRVFAENFANGEGKWWAYAYGGHDTTAIVIRTLAYQLSDEVRETIDCLSKYPILDENDESELEMEREQEGWEDYGRDDFKRALRSYLEKRFFDRGVETDDSGRDADSIVDALTDSQLDALYAYRCRETNINGGGTCLWEGESHPHFFCNEMAFGSDASYREDFGRDPWDGYVPALRDDGSGKIDYQAGEVASWIPVCAWRPSCPRCGKLGTSIDSAGDSLPPSLWESPCPDFGCDVPEQGSNADPALAEIASYILRSWDVGECKPYNHLFASVDDPIGAAFDRLASACEASGDKATAVAFHFRDPRDAHHLMLAGRLRSEVRARLRGIIRGEICGIDQTAHVSTIEPVYLASKPVCCIVYGLSCCEHGEHGSKYREWCVRTNTRGTCPVHGKKEASR